MDILGYSIDTQFVYSVGPIIGDKQRSDGYYIEFELKFKDGRTHKVNLSYNYFPFYYRGKVYAGNIKQLTKKQLERVPIKLERDMKQLKTLRYAIIKSMGK